MQTRKLGTLVVSAIGMGCMGMSHATGTPMSIENGARVVREAVDVGYTFFDTAKNYGHVEDPYHNEKILGKALSGIRDKVVIASKCGVEFDYAVDPDKPPLLYDSSPEGIRTSIEGSLKRLQTDYIDLYFQARMDPNVEPETVAETMGQLIKEGKIRHWGVSEAEPEYIKRANAVTPMTAVENRYNMINRVHEDLIPFHEANDMGWVAHGPMFKGLLGGGFQKGAQFARDDWRSNLVNDENLEKYASLIAYLHELAEAKGVTPGALSIAWILAQKPYIVPIPGMRSKERLEENAKAADVTFTPEELAKIDELSGH